MGHEAGQLQFVRDREGNTWAYLLLPRRGNAIPWNIAVLNPQTPVWEVFRESLLTPLLQSVCIGGILAAVLSVILARSITNPIRALQAASRQIAKGQSPQPLPEKGSLELRELAASFNSMNAQLQASQQAQRDFFTNISHELKTPLTSIQGFSQAIQDFAPPESPQTEHFAGIILAESQRMERLVNEILVMARWQSHPTLQHTPVELGALLSQIANGQQPQIDSKQQTLHIDIATELWVNGDSDRLSQVFTNLLANAVQYTPNQGQIFLEARATESNIHITVRDTGIGIDPIDLPRIFERFYRADKSRKASGNYGLGLSITQEIVAAHGGKIWVESEPQRGSAFHVTLPKGATGLGSTPPSKGNPT